MSVGRNLCHDAIETAQRLRRYAELLDEFDSAETALLADETRVVAGRLESLIPTILYFEGEQRPALTRGET